MTARKGLMPMTGKIVALFPTHGFIKAAGARSDFFFHKRDVIGATLAWPMLRVGDDVAYELMSEQNLVRQLGHRCGTDAARPQ